MSELPGSAPVSFRSALWFWLKLGFLSFGGPAGQIALLHAELVTKRQWISEPQFLHALNYCMLLPGPEAQQMATYLGWRMHRYLGGIAAGILFLFPGLLVLIGLAWAYCTYAGLPQVTAALGGIKPVIVAIIAFAAYRIGSRILKEGWLWGLCGLSLIASAFLKLPYPLIVLSAGFVGFLWQKKQDWLETPTGMGIESKATDSAPSGPACAQLQGPTNNHWRRLTAITAGVLALWLSGMGGLILLYGPGHLLPDMAWFFTKTAFLTFGGAYAVLPYVFDASVSQYHWLSAQEMMDGLALGETTPGPLILIVTFVGYVAGAHAELLGPGQSFGSGMLAALVATFFTFLPSFLFILAGAPLVEATGQNLRLKAPLTAICSSVVGVILNLAWFLGYQTFWPEGFGGSIDWQALALFALACLALFRLKLGIAPLLFGAGLFGILRLWI